MRPIEILLLLANLMAFLGLVVHQPSALHWMRYLAPIALLITGAQIVLEGPRWQMVPSYALAGLFFLIWLLQISLASGLATALGVLGLAVSIVLPIIVPVFRFPQPTGPYAIGTLTYHWVDTGRPEIFTPDPNDYRELMVQIWYPAKGDPSLPRAPYIQDPDAVARALALNHNLPEFTFLHWRYVTTHSIKSALVADDQPSYPVLILLVGLGGYRQVQTFQVEELVSHGYIVAAIDQPYSAAMVVFPNGRQAPYDARFDPPYFRAGYDPRTDPPHSAFLDAHLSYLAQDVMFTLDQLTTLNRDDPNGILTGKLDLQHAGFFGHSFGGIVGAEACRLEPRLRACLLEDAFMPADVVQSGLKQPTMFITRDAETMRLERRRSGGWPEPAIEEHLTTMRAVYESLPGNGYYVQVPGIFHIDMTDVPLLTPLASGLGISGPVGVGRAHEIVNAYSVAFFDRHLKGLPTALLDGPSKQYPEVLLETRQP